MDRQQYDDYRDIILDTIKFLVEKKRLPLKPISSGIVPGKNSISVTFVDSIVTDFINKEYGVNWPTSFRVSQVNQVVVGFPADFYEQDVDFIDQAFDIDPKQSHAVKLRCRIARQL